MKHAAYVGRVGGLAVALGIGLAISSQTGAAWADTDDSVQSEPSSGSRADNESQATKRTKDREGSSDSAAEGTAESEDTGETEKPDSESNSGSDTTVDLAPEPADEDEDPPSPAAALTMTTMAGAGRRDNATAQESVTVGAAPTGVALDGDETHAYVANSTGRSVSVVETVTGSVLNTIPVPGRASAVAVHGDRAYVTLRSTGKVAVIDTATDKVVTSVSVGWLPSAIAVSPNGSRVYVTNAGSGTMSVIDTATNKKISSTWVGWTPSGVTVSPDGSRVYAASKGSERISVFDTALSRVVANIKVGDSPTDVAVTRDGAHVYATYGTGRVAVINTAAMGVEVAAIVVGPKPTALVISANGSQVYVANSNDTVSVIDTATNAVVASLPVDANPETGSHDVALSADGATLFVTDEKDGVLRVVSTNAAPNQAPIVVGTPFWSSPNWTTGHVTGGVTFSDPDGNTLSYIVANGPAKGAVSLNQINGQTLFTYGPTDEARHTAHATPGEDTDTFTIVASDGAATAAVSYTVIVAPQSPVNRAPVLQGEPSMSVDLNTGQVHGLFAVVEPDGDLVSYSDIDPPQGQVNLFGSSGPATVYTYNFAFYPTHAARRAAAATPGQDSATFGVTINDGRGGVTSFTIDVPVEPRPADMPVWNGPTTETYDAYTGYTIGNMNLSDPDHDPLVYGTAYGPWYGDLNIDNATGDYVYVPYLNADNGWPSYEIVTVSVDDGTYVTYYDWWVQTFRDDLAPL